MPQLLPPPHINKVPKGNKDYGWDWTNWLAGDTLAASVWTVDPGLTVGTGASAPTFSATKATVYLSGGVVGVSYKVTNNVTTASVPPRIEERTFYIDIVAVMGLS